MNITGGASVTRSKSQQGRPRWLPPEFFVVRAELPEIAAGDKNWFVDGSADLDPATSLTLDEAIAETESRHDRQAH